MTEESKYYKKLRKKKKEGRAIRKLRESLNILHPYAKIRLRSLSHTGPLTTEEGIYADEKRVPKKVIPTSSIQPSSGEHCCYA